MLDRLFSFIHNKYQPLNIVIAESNEFHKAFLARAIAKIRPYHNIIVIDSLEEIFTLMYGEVKIDVVFFDLDSGADINDLKIIRAISPEIAFVHWSNCQHPEIIELLYDLSVNSFCLKRSSPDTFIDAIDSIGKNPKILYMDELLNKCLPLLAS